MILTNNPFILYPLALLSAAGVVVLMAMLNAILFLLLTGSANKATHWRHVILPMAVGLTVTFAIILLIDVMRFAFTQTWDGFVIPGA